MIRNVQLEVTEVASGSPEYRQALEFEAKLPEMRDEIVALRDQVPTRDQPGKAPKGPHTVDEVASLRRMEALVPAGRTLATWTKEFGGYNGTSTGPDGRDYAVSLEPWKNRDPASTVISIRFKAIDTDLVGTKMTDRFPSA